MYAAQIRTFGRCVYICVLRMGLRRFYTGVIVDLRLFPEFRTHPTMQDACMLYGACYTVADVDLRLFLELRTHSTTCRTVAFYTGVVVDLRLFPEFRTQPTMQDACMLYGACYTVADVDLRLFLELRTHPPMQDACMLYGSSRGRRTFSSVQLSS